MQAQALRDSAAALLREASHCSYSALSDTLTRRALAQLKEARRLLDETAAYTSQTARRLH